MNAMVLAAGLGTRLRPWTLTHPKALVPVDGVPMLERVIGNLRRQGFDRIVVNAHHFARQVIDFVHSKDFGADIYISDESRRLLDTGGGIVKAAQAPGFGTEPLLVHNTDILGNADLAALMQSHMEGGSAATLLVSDRNSSRRLVYDGNMTLRGWHDVERDLWRPAGFVAGDGESELAFSGIHVVGPEAVREMEGLFGQNPFPVMDYYLSPDREGRVAGMVQNGLEVLDIGKPASLSRASEVLSRLG